jgi:hypothetical protein
MAGHGAARFGNPRDTHLITTGEALRPAAIAT